ncbi:ATP-dependent DNA helicase RecG [Paractinoplanes abujensis]|uniref:ATP-dependent DNA helicase RecG n=1 Tax=Paractinoplanes abujensis TaxID=882441 RepID=A0A7W7CYW5_9ACTN|nr:ATP-dependent DNA helicase RecG [Actinoplanes abujensis]MBB4697230.1 ATP-dependent DNA helicase RecG [Actinoplanes abujensis]GID18296.1 ATP-dependent DNA helicase RecG [Actinoplanes abujensis]
MSETVETATITTTDTPLDQVLKKHEAKALATHLDLHTAGDLIYHFPRRYDERGEHTDMQGLQIGEQVTVLAQVQSTTVKPMRQRRGNMLEITIGDGSGASLTCTFFNQAWRERELRRGRWGLFAGKVTDFRGKRQLNSPAYQLLSADATQDEAAEEIEEFAGALIPVYPAAQAVPTWTITRCVRTVLDTFQPPKDPLPSAVRAKRDLVGIGMALREIHRPSSRGALEMAKKRLKWDEAFAVQLTLVQRRARAAASPGRSRPRSEGGILAKFDASLPYELTEGQAQVGEEIAADLARPHPMHRLLQGEVGSGKTLVSVRAMLQVVDAGGQAALLAPTEVLATQHYRGIAAQLGALGRAGEIDGDPAGTQLTLVTGSLGAAARRAALAKVADGTAGIVVGTHALLYEGVDFHDLGLVVVDEQHRFGVEQRDALRAKATTPPHVLVMTATPIPRTVAMTVYGDLETSVLTQLPRGRSPIASHVVPPEKPAFLDRAWRRVREEVQKGHQAYVVCPRIGDGGSDDDAEPPSDNEPARRPPLAVTEVAPILEEGPLHGLRIAMLHGKLPADEKDAIMRRFAAGDLDVLVATTVIEVGVDVPNSTVMIIMDADRFGVSQLHQLRGRVGRGSAPGICLLVTESVEGTTARERLDAVASTTDGFKLSEIDLEQRREGDVLGASQSGKHSHLRLLSLLRDAKLITEARAEADELVGDDPSLKKYPELAASVAALVDEERAEYLEKG